jgi:lysophospholipase L1-like esterase
VSPLRASASAGLVVALALLAGCDERPPVSNDTVLVFGDSLVQGGAATIAAGLEQHGWRAVVDGRPGWSIEQWAPELPPLAAVVRPRVAVVVLGTNDCAPVCGDVAGGIDHIMATMLRVGVERVFWLNVQEDASYPRNPGHVNLQLRSAAMRWPRLFVVDLDGTLGGDPALHIADGVHFNDLGNVALTNLIVERVEQAR